MDALFPLLGPLIAFAVGIVAWSTARGFAPAFAANDNAPRSRARPLRATAPRRTNTSFGNRAMLSKGKSETRRPAGGLSVIGTDVTVTGNIRTDGDLHVDGIVEGDIACGSLVQGGSSRIVGTVAAKSARLAGTIEGTVAAAALTIEKSAKLRGDASYQTVQIETGAQVDGRMTHLASGQAPANDGPLRLVDASDAAG